MINLPKIRIAAILILFTGGSLASAYGQSYGKLVKSGDEEFLLGKYDKAAEYYDNAGQTISKLKKKHLELFYKLGFCQMQLKEYKKANNTFGKYQSIAKKTKPDLRELKQVSEWKEWCSSEISDYGSTGGTRDPNIKVTNIATLNSSLDDFGAFMTYDNTLIFFTSNRFTSKYKDLPNLNGNVYFAEYKDGTFSQPKEISTLSEKLDEVSSSISSDNLTIYLTVSKDFNETADIYYCQKIGGVWSSPIKLDGEVNSKYWDGYPSISEDGKTLYFSSNRPGSKGKDIYFSVKKSDGSWGKPKNIGYPINTKFDEITPHIDASGKKLYFSSKGHISNGGFDIYYSEFEASNLWGEPVNMGMPINSDRDDIFYVTTADKNVALFSSKRPGGNGIYDIYKAEIIKKKKKSHEELIDNEKPIVVMEDPVKKKEALNTKEEEIIVVERPKTEKITKSEKPVESTKKEVVKTTPPPKPEPKPAYASTGNIYTSSTEGLYFKVQIGAYKNHITKYHKVFTSKLDPNDITEEYIPPLYKYTIGKYFTIKTASAYKVEIRRKGYPDAFLTCYYNNKRIPMSEAKEVLKTKTRIN